MEKRVRENDSDEFYSPEVKKLRHDLFDLLDESDPDPGVQDLASVMKSFEEEILSGSSSPVAPPVVDLTGDSVPSGPELDFLLGASDDELGLPPTATSSSEDEDLFKVKESESGTDSTRLIGEFWGFEDEIPSYDSFEFLNVENNVGGGGEYVSVEGLFDYSDADFGSSEVTDSSWRFETL